MVSCHQQTFRILNGLAWYDIVYDKMDAGGGARVADSVDLTIVHLPHLSRGKMTNPPSDAELRVGRGDHR
jgi:hypothetical protein